MFRDFCLTTTVHGIRYIIEPKRRFLERFGLSKMNFLLFSNSQKWLVKNVRIFQNLVEHRVYIGHGTLHLCNSEHLDDVAWASGDGDLWWQNHFNRKYSISGRHHLHHTEIQRRNQWLWWWIFEKALCQRVSQLNLIKNRSVKLNSRIRYNFQMNST